MSSSETVESTGSFSDLGLSPAVLNALTSVGYETPSPIQAQIIPHILAGKDVLGQAQTGTGKTAAFALPILCQIDAKKKHPQVLVLAPTRELAIQVAEAFQKYASGIKGMNVLPIYGGEGFTGQLRQLQRGAQIIVGTPGRVMDHMRRGTLNVSKLTHLVLDEADEMLRMGFIDDVEWVMEQLPEKRQIALFSATMPKEIHKIAKRFLVNPEEIRIKTKTSTAPTIEQRYWLVSGARKLDALTRIMEVIDYTAAIIFVRTKTATLELTEKLQARGYSTAALNGDIDQKNRTRTVEQLKAGGIDILVATDVAARGLDVERISHVINYDIPYDTEAYVHRIGRTGRAGREGAAILFVAPREKRMLRAIEKATGKVIEPMQLPSADDINRKRLESIKVQIAEQLTAKNLDVYRQIITEIQAEQEAPIEDIAAALALINKDFALLSDRPEKSKRKERDQERFDREDRPERDRKPRRNNRNDDTPTEEGMERFRIEVGHDDKVSPGNIVGCIANEAELDSEHIGRIQIFDDHSLVDLPEGMPKELFNHLKKAWVCGKRLGISKVAGNSAVKPAKRNAGKPARSRRRKPKDV